MAASNEAHSHLARPYARAAFSLAEEGGDLSGWSDQLALLAAVVSDERVYTHLRSPSLTRERRAELLLGICGDSLGDGARNLVRLMAANGRLELLPDVAGRFESLRAEAEARVDAHVASARELTDEQRERITASLRKRLDRDIRLHCEIDESLLGGAVIRAGDLVIDGSLKGRLTRLASSLAH
jgi:F-type H+-transporting ATPase subunit delta